MIHILYIGAGGFLGSVSRYLVSKYLNNFIPSLPIGTLAVNVAGSFLLGFILYGSLFGRSISPDVRDFITIGFIGAFTTMSTFSYETLRLMELNELMFMGLNIILNVLLSLIAVYFGKELAVLITK